MSTDKKLKQTKKIGKLLAQIRKKKGYSIYRLAIESDVSSGLITRLEKGEREPRITTLLKILDGLEISASNFFKELEQ